MDDNRNEFEQTNLEAQNVPEDDAQKLDGRQSQAVPQSDAQQSQAVQKSDVPQSDVPHQPQSYATASTQGVSQLQNSQQQQTSQPQDGQQHAAQSTNFGAGQTAQVQYTKADTQSQAAQAQHAQADMQSDAQAQFTQSQQGSQYTQSQAAQSQHGSQYTQSQAAQSQYGPQYTQAQYTQAQYTQSQYTNPQQGAGPYAQSSPQYGQPYGRPYKKKNRGVVIAIIIIVAICALSLIIGAMRWFGNSATTELSLPTNDYIAKLYVVGTIGDTNDSYTSTTTAYHHQFSIDKIAQIRDDEHNKGLIIYVDSPGGAVYESEELYSAIKDYKEATARPVYVYMGHTAASGGYYISAPADKIYANKNTLTGSIGVIYGTFYDMKDLLDKLGVDAVDITSGANKGMGSSTEHMTEEQKAIIQSLVDESYADFVNIVAEGRGMDVEDVKVLADGRIYSSRQAQANGLIDEVGTERELIDAIRAEVEDNNIQIFELKQDGETRLIDMFMSADSPIYKQLVQAKAKTELQLALEALEGNNHLGLMYLYEG
ncbi:MAG: signal peptide peptidase SppA [Clostridiales Family XIII bacterium]|jgi:protease-4|nr:signal peptide peptidase SppA [Clostridiales Family XIII bacterium]